MISASSRLQRIESMQEVALIPTAEHTLGDHVE